MTTAHRPTYNPSRGSNNQGGNLLYNPSQQYSSKDLPGNLTLKKRHMGQGSVRDVNKKDFKKELLERENKTKNKRSDLVSSIYNDSEFDDSKVDITSDILHELNIPAKKQRLDSISQVSEIPLKSNNNITADRVFIQDKDDEFSEEEHSKKSEKSVNEKSDSNEDEDEDSEEELYREYEKIKRMREEEKRQKEIESSEKIKQQNSENPENSLGMNPLLNNTYSLKKKWFEDTVFKNQSKNEPKVKKRFINDTVRSDFHRKFLAKSIQ